MTGKRKRKRNGNGTEQRCPKCHRVILGNRGVLTMHERRCTAPDTRKVFVRQIPSKGGDER